jgi:hypothetical protein
VKKKMRNPTTWRRVLTLLAILAMVGVPAIAQQNSGNLFGTVIDNEGARLPGVTVTLTGPSESIAVTDAEGQFRFLNLDPGNYQIEANLDGYGSVIYEKINIRIGRNTTIELQLNQAVEDVITVTTESPLLDERKISSGISVTSLELQKIPTARDPWAVAGQTPGVLMDRINVGGNESGQQPNFIGAGSNGTQNKFMIDGVDITDQSAVGASSTYFGFEQFEEMSFTTGGTDVTIATPGVQLNMVTKRGTNEWRGSGSYNNTSDSYQSSDNLNKGDLAPGQVDSGESLTGNQIDDITQYGAEVGGFVWKDRIWIWGSYDKNDINQSVFGGGIDNTLLENTAYKVNAQITGNNSFVYTWNEGDKIKNGRGASTSRPPETTWDQGGPSPLRKAEDTHVFSSSFFLTGSWSDMKGGFFLEPKGGRDGTMWVDGGGVYHGSYFYLDNARPSERLRLDGSAFFNTGAIAHELKFGYSFREVSEQSQWGAPGNNLYTEVDPDDPSSVTGYGWRETNTNVEAEYTSLWLQDTFTVDRLTVNVGLRYDQQEGINGKSSSPAMAFDPALLPALDFQGNDPNFQFEDIVPRLGATYALGEQRKTLLRASYSQFADQLGLGLISEVNPLGSAFAIYVGTDTNGDGILDPSEPHEFAVPVGFDPSNPTASSSPNLIDPDIEAMITTEFILGIEHAFMPEFVGGFTVTWRQSDDYYDKLALYRDANGNLVTPTRSDYVLCNSSVCGTDDNGNITGSLPDGTTYSTPVYYVRPDFGTDTGGVLVTNTDRSTEYIGYTISATKRLSNKWMMRTHFTFYDWEWSLGPEFRNFDDPTNSWNDNGDFHEWNVDDEGALFAEQSGGSGAVDLFLNSRWSFNISGLYQLPWGINVSANLNGREGYPIAWQDQNVSTPDGNKDVETARVGRDRVDDIITTDVRIDKDFQIGDLGLTLSVDVFNLFNEGYVIGVQDRTDISRSGYVDQIIGPRVARLGVRLAWK